MCPGCNFSNDKLYALKRHFEGTNAKKTHTKEHWEATLKAQAFKSGSAEASEDGDAAGDTAGDAAGDGDGDGDAAVERDTRTAGGASTSGGKSPFVKAPASKTKRTKPVPTEPCARLTKDVAPAASGDGLLSAQSGGGLTAEDINKIVRQLSLQLLSDTSLRQEFVQTMAIESVTYPQSAFCREPDAMVRNMEGGMKLWRSAMANETGSGLIELLVTKHISLFKNLRPSYEAGQVGVYKGGKVWVSIGQEEAATTMLQRAEHDMLSLYEANDTSTETNFKNYRTQMQRFLTNVGCKLGWDHTPYEVEPEAEYDEVFYDDVLQALICSVNQTLSA